MSGVNKTLVDSAVRSLNDKAEQLGMDRRFEFVPGSRTMGRMHSLIEKQSTMVHPAAETKIGHTLSEALTYVTAMNHGLLAAMADRDHKRAHVAQPTYATIPSNIDL